MEIAAGLVNDLEPAAVRLCPPVGELLATLRTAGALGAGLSGSGPTVFGIFPSERAAREALAGLTLAPPLWAGVTATIES